MVFADSAKNLSYKVVSRHDAMNLGRDRRTADYGCLILLNKRTLCRKRFDVTTAVSSPHLFAERWIISSVCTLLLISFFTLLSAKCLVIIWPVRLHVFLTEGGDLWI